MKLYTVELSRLWLRGRSNHLSYDNKKSVADILVVTDVVQLAPNPDDDWRSIGCATFNHAFPDGASVPMIIRGLALRLAEDQDRRVLVMCNAGRNRAPLFAAMMWLYMHKNTTGREAITHLRSIRPNALANPAFVRYLENMP